MSTKGTVVAAMVAGLFASAQPAMAGDAKAGGKVKCAGINSCKGKGMCKSATSSCQGMNDCKGKGWIEVTDKECKDKGGKVVTGGH